MSINDRERTGQNEQSPDLLNSWMRDGILGLQAVASPKKVHKLGAADAAHPYLSQLASLNENLGTAGFLTSPHELFLTNDYPTYLIVNNALLSAAFSPVIEQAERLDLARTWISASSTGKGRTFPAKFIASHMAASVIDEKLQTFSKQSTAYIEADNLVVTLDREGNHVRHAALACGALATGVSFGLKRILNR